MRKRTLFAITVTMFALPALGREPPVMPGPRMLPPAPVMPVPRALPAAPPVMPATVAPHGADFDIVYEVRIVKAPVGFCERVGLKPTGNAVLGETEVRRVLEAAEGQRDATVTQLPKVTAFDGQEAAVRNGETQSFVTGGEMTKVQGQMVFVPKQTTVELGDALTVSGRVSTDGQTVTVRAKLTRTALAGDVPLVPVTTFITPVFEGGSQGKPVPFTQFLQTADVKTEQVEKTVILTAGGTIVLGGWKETGERPAKPKGLLKKQPPAPEYEVVVLATVRALRIEPEVPANLVISYKLRNVAAADAVTAVTALLKGKNLAARITADPAYNNVVVAADPALQKQIGDIIAKLDENPPARFNQTVKLRNVAAADVERALSAHFTGKGPAIALVAEPVSNTLLVSAEGAQLKQVLAMIEALDAAPTQVMVQAMVIQVPRGFVKDAGLDLGGTPGQSAWTLSPREVKMLNGLIRAAKDRGELDVLSRPQLQVADNQTGYVQVGQNFPVETTGLVKATGGAVKVQASIEYVPTGLSMRLTPRVAPDGKSVQLRTETQLTTVVPAPDAAADKAATPKPVFNTQSVDCTTAVRTGDTLVLAVVGGENETLVIVTPHVVRGEAAK